MLANFPYHNEGEHIERQFRIWYALCVGVVFGLLSLSLALLINRHHNKLGWKIYAALVSVSFLWLVILVPEVHASGLALGVSSLVTGTIYQIEASVQQEEGHSTENGSARVQHAFSIDINEAASLQAGEAFIIRQRHTVKLKILKTPAIVRSKRARLSQTRLPVTTTHTPSDSAVIEAEIPKLLL